MPRQCGIATFSGDLAQSLLDLDPNLNVSSIAMSDRPDYTYPDRVNYQIPESDRPSYQVAAEYLNRSGYDVLSVQHEYGIFGGEAGSYLMNLLRVAKMPIVTTLHTVLSEPSWIQREVMDEVLSLSERIVVMSHKAVSILTDVHGIDSEKVDLIPHGIPTIPRSEEFRKSLNIQGPMILTFGLLSPDKGIQYVIEAMAEIVKKSPGTVYVVVGATHPSVRSQGGESYRESLVKLAEDLGVSQSVRFVDRFVTKEELVQYLGAMDIYVTPYLNPKQITSGTLAYSVGAGKAVISTPYVYALDILDEGRGIIVPFRDSKAIADSVIHLATDPFVREEMGRKAAEFGKDMLWPQVGQRYLDSFTRAKSDSAQRLSSLIHQSARTTTDMNIALPDMRLDHLFHLSDDTGILQHATFTVPNRFEGYCVDDNARALLFTALLENGSRLSSDVSVLQSRYLSFVAHSYNAETGRFRNFMSFQRTWLEDRGSEDSHARTLWGLGAVIHRSKSVHRRDIARNLFDSAIPAMYETTSLRTWAYAILATQEYLKGFPEDKDVQPLQATMADRIWSQYEQQECADWPWFEKSLTYANARLPQSLIIAGASLGEQDMVAVGLNSLEWLMKIQTGPDGCFAPIGSDHFYIRGGVRSFFDQQPVEAAGAVSACLTALEVTKDERWMTEANRAFEWFLGKNMLSKPVYDQSTGGCHDGLHKDSLNRNQGAESTLSFLCALAEIRHARQVLREATPVSA